MALNESDIKRLAHEAAQEAVRTTLITLGVDVDDPIKAQEDFAVLRQVGDLVRDPEFRKDIEHTRAWRQALNEVKSKGLATAVGVIVTGALAMLWLGFKQYLPFGN